MQVATAEPDKNSQSHLAHLTGMSSSRLLAWVSIVFVAPTAEHASHATETDDGVCDSLQTAGNSPFKW